MKRISIIFISVIFVFTVFAQSKFSANTLMFLNKVESKNITKDKSVHKLLKRHNNEYYVDAIIEVTDDAYVSIIENLGAVIATRCNDMMTISIPINKIREVAGMEFVKRIEVSKLMHLTNDVARSRIGMNKIHEGEGLERPFTGKGVLYGTYDVGIDFNNLAFKDSLGNNRFVSAYLPMNDTGKKVNGNVFKEDGTIEENGVFPGSEFIGQTLVDLCTDTRKEIHGTHTICTAAGSFKGNKYYGMAPDAEIIACGSDANDLTSINIINSVSYIMGEAESLAKPVVVNLSLAGNIGPHDGSSFESRFLDELSGKGKIIVVSAGNEGEGQLHISKRFKNEDNELKTFLNIKDNKFEDVTIGFWSDTKTKFNVSVVAYNIAANKTEYATPLFVQQEDGNVLEITSEKNSEFAKYFNGGLTLSGALENNSKYCTLVNLALTPQKGYRVGLVLTAREGSVNGWTEGSYLKFEDENTIGWTDGNADMSISDMATGVNTISVGAYDAYDTFISVDNKPISFKYYKISDLAGFSSYGPDANGNMKPEICAPGFIVISAVNGYSNFYNASSTHVPYNETIDGHLEVWAPMWGTSMSSPCVAGAIATWLEVNPNLTPSEVRTIIKKTAKIDDYVLSAPNKWGAGKFDAYKGLCEVIKRASSDLISEDISKDVKVFPNPSDGRFNILTTFGNADVELNIYDSMGRNVYNSMLSNVSTSIDLRGKLSRGVYFLQINCPDKKYVEKLVIN